jgi:hypothetical protein
MSGVTRAELATSSARILTGSQSPGPATASRRDGWIGALGTKCIQMLD